MSLSPKFDDINSKLDPLRAASSRILHAVLAFFGFVGIVDVHVFVSGSFANQDVLLSMFVTVLLFLTNTDTASQIGK